jgi:hypothetical protein
MPYPQPLHIALALTSGCNNSPRCGVLRDLFRLHVVVKGFASCVESLAHDLGRFVIKDAARHEWND